MAKILVIENDKLLQKAFLRILKNHEVSLVATGLEAMQLLEEGDFDAVLSDYDLDGPIDGGDVWKWVQVNRPDLVSHYAFCSANDDVEQICARANIPFVAKPASTQQVKDVVQSILKEQPI